MAKPVESSAAACTLGSGTCVLVSPRTLYDWCSVITTILKNHQPPVTGHGKLMEPSPHMRTGSGLGKGFVLIDHVQHGPVQSAGVTRLSRISPLCLWDEVFEPAVEGGLT